jgi:hypothetical protein
MFQRFTILHVSNQPYHPPLFNHPLIFLCQYRWSLAWRGFGFESRWRHGCLSLLSVLVGRSLVQWSHMKCMCLPVISEREIWTGPGPLGLSSHWTEDCRLWSFSLRIFSTNTWLTVS